MFFFRWRLNCGALIEEYNNHHLQTITLRRTRNPVFLPEQQGPAFCWNSGELYFIVYFLFSFFLNNKDPPFVETPVSCNFPAKEGKRSSLDTRLESWHQLSLQSTFAFELNHHHQLWLKYFKIPGKESSKMFWSQVPVVRDVLKSQNLTMADLMARNETVRILIIIHSWWPTYFNWFPLLLF